MNKITMYTFPIKPIHRFQNVDYIDGFLSFPSPNESFIQAPLVTIVRFILDETDVFRVKLAAPLMVRVVVHDNLLVVRAAFVAKVVVALDACFGRFRAVNERILASQWILASTSSSRASDIFAPRITPLVVAAPAELVHALDACGFC
jgi:hypothetical protein